MMTPPPPELRIHIYPDLGGFGPVKYHLQVLFINSEILATKMPEGIHQISKLTKDQLNMLFTEFKLYFQWNPTFDAKITKLWKSTSSKQYRDRMRYVRLVGGQAKGISQSAYRALKTAWKDPNWRKNSRINKDNRAKSRHGLIAHYMGAKSRRHIVDEMTVGNIKPNVSQIWDRMYSKIEEGERIWTNEGQQQRGGVIKENLTKASQPDPENPSATILPSEEEQMKIVAAVVGIGKRGSVLGLGADASLIVPPPPERRRARVVEEELNRLRVEDQRREDEHQRTIAEVQAQCAEVKKKCDALDEVFRRLASQGVDVAELLGPQQPQSSSSQNSVRQTPNLADK